jgi:hypothetical protein
MIRKKPQLAKFYRQLQEFSEQLFRRHLPVTQLASFVVPPIICTEHPSLAASAQATFLRAYNTVKLELAQPPWTYRCVVQGAPFPWGALC